MSPIPSAPSGSTTSAIRLHLVAQPREVAPRQRARQGEVTIRTAIEELVQLNQGHQFTYDRDALVKMLDEALARIK